MSINYKYEDIRNFYFENETGKRIDCQEIDGKLFLHNVTGLGYEKDVEYVRVGNTFVKNKDELMQNVISGELEFYDTTYDKYKEFTDFILKSEELRLVYVPKRTNRVEFYRDIDVVKIEQNGEDEYNVMSSPISIYCKTLWYKENKVLYTTEALDNEIRWDFEWDSIFSDFSNRNIEVTNNGHVPAPFLLELNGFLENPCISIYVNDNKVNELSLDCTIDENEKLMYSTRDNELFLYKILEDGTTENLFNSLDLNNINFFKLPIGTSKIKLTADEDITNSKITIYEEYIAV